MSDFRLVKVKVHVRYDDGRPGWFEADLSPDCRNVVIGVDAVGIAGSYDPPERDQLLLPIAEQDFETAAADTGLEPQQRAGGVRDEPPAQAGGGTKTRSAESSTTYAAQISGKTPDVCEYVNGKWYCWPS